MVSLSSNLSVLERRKWSTLQSRDWRFKARNCLAHLYLRLIKQLPGTAWATHFQKFTPITEHGTAGWYKANEDINPFIDLQLKLPFLGRSSYVPDLKSAWLESPAANKTSLVQTLLALLHEVADEIQESTDSKKDSADRLLSVRNILPLFSLDELSILADQVNKSQYPLVWYCILLAIIYFPSYTFVFQMN